ncbi:hypothetical protein [Nocardiopsis sp. CA-288880]|uniref:hypothetical protein n=1 Tax=Nocardiopsis sp. CA-288880 TaxID=3239995 RepID=UPI003D972978
MHHLDLPRPEVAEASGRITGPLRPAGLPTATGTLVAPLLLRFAERHPRVGVRPVEGFDRDVRDRLRRGRRGRPAGAGAGHGGPGR